MVIKLKNKLIYALIFLISMTIISLSMLCAVDVYKNREFLKKDSYFKSGSFNVALYTYFDNVRNMVTKYDNYNLKSASEKVTTEEVSALKQSYQNSLNIRIREIENTYDGLIRTAEQQKNSERQRTLKDEMQRLIKEAYTENSKTDDELKSEMLKKKNSGYETLLSNIETNRSLKYYIKNNKTGKIYSNIENPQDIEQYIKNNALYVESFPSSSAKDYNLASINSWFQSNNFDGRFIVLSKVSGYSQINENYIYYSSIRQRIIKEIFIFIIGLCIGAALLIITIFKNKHFSVFYTAFLKKFSMDIPIDIRAVFFIVYSAIMLEYLKSVNLFFLPLRKTHIIKFVFVLLYFVYLLLSLVNFKSILTNGEMLKEQWNKSIIKNFSNNLKDSFIFKKVAFKVMAVLLFTAIFGMAISFAFLGIVRRQEEIVIFSMVFVLLYFFTVFMYILKRVASFNKIVKGTEEISSGNLDSKIETNCGGSIDKLANNINNMKEGFKSSVENQLKSERLKTELITNVSHDLKTPLTSIVNYIDLLKKEGITQEESIEFINILDKKAQRLKVLIEDLFEAAKMSSGAVELNIETVDVVSLLRQAIGEFDEKIRNSKLSFKMNLPKNKVQLELDGKKTWRVFENLIGNILKYSQPDTRVYIDLIEEKEAVKIIFKNISAYELDFKVDEIFERFKRGDKARATEGSGLGLAIAKSIVELQAGRLSIEVDGDLFKVTVEFSKKKN